MSREVRRAAWAAVAKRAAEKAEEAEAAAEEEEAKVVVREESSEVATVPALPQQKRQSLQGNYWLH